ncbi:MAG TPA: penicillin-binding transpeptidase domain-containing protein, partial [Solirubrobacteraceae bacterium]|nr:penicillin-binding transpeptidase domain-containing protein [Solirubrobacteraceae bacterium]
KTGTAERQPRRDQSWYVAYVPHPKRPIVVVVTVEEGGFGAATAAPIACRMLAKFYAVKDAPCARGDSVTQ